MAMYETPYPAFDRILPAFVPQDYKLQVSPDWLNQSHFSDLDPYPSVSLDVDFASLGLAPSVAAVVTSIQQYVSPFPPHSSFFETLEIRDVFEG